MKEQEKNRIEITCASGKKLVAEVNPDPTGYKEIFIYLEDSDGVCQDLAIVGERYKYTPDVEPIIGEYSVKVYSDETSDDWQEEIVIKEYKEGTR